MDTDRSKKLARGAFLGSAVGLVLSVACGGSGNVPQAPHKAVDAGPETCPNGCPANYFCAEGTCLPTYANKTDGGFMFADAGHPVDGGVEAHDAGDPNASYCKACDVDSDCGTTGAKCLCGPSCPPGYCAPKCESTSDCPSGATCTAVTEGSAVTRFMVCEPASGSCP
jgi:hypothetical protein